MDAIIKQAVQEEINRRADTSSNVSSAQHEVNERSTADQVFSASRSREKRTTSRLTNLLQRVRNGGKSNKRACKEHRLQVRWLHYNRNEKSFLPVKTKNGGGKRFIVYSDADPLSLEAIKNKGAVLFFPNGTSKFAGNLKDMAVVVCDTTQTAIFDFPGGGMVEDYLNANGLYPSVTHFFIRTQAVQDIVEEFEDDDDILSSHSDCSRQNIYSEENTPNNTSNRNHQVQSSDSLWQPGSEESTQKNNIQPDNRSSSCQGLRSSEAARSMCDVCNCTYISGQSCLRCQQNDEYYASLASDSAPSHEQLQNTGPEEEEFPDTEQLRDQRLTYLLRNQDPTNTESSNIPTIPVSNDHIPGTERREGDQQGEPTFQILVVHRTCIIMDMIKHFKDESVMKCELLFKVINERGKEEIAQGSGVNKEVFCLFWKEFSNSMTIGETERVPFVRHDHFVKEWEAVGRILVKGYSSVSYFPLFLSKAFMCRCLFGTEIPDDIVMDSFMKYLSPEEEELIKDYLGKSKFPEDNDELFNFLERFNCRSLVNESNLRKVLLEIANQELVQKPHVMLATWQPTVQELKCYPQFQDCSAVQSFYDTIKPTTKKVLEKLSADPRSEGERDALKFLQRYIRGLDRAKLSQFLRFTTASDVLSTGKINVSFTKLEGASSRPIAHTCGPLLELPSTYSNFVELREQFHNILNKDSWEMDIV